MAYRSPQNLLPPDPPSIIKGICATSPPLILLVATIANNLCSHTHRAEFPKGFHPEMRVFLLVAGLLRSKPCL